MLSVPHAPQPGYTGPVSDGGACFFPGTSSMGTTDVEVCPSVFSVELWFWPPTPSGDMIVFWQFGQVIWASTKVFAFNEPSFGLGAPGTSTTQRWHHVVGVQSGSGRILYVDGSSVASDSHTTAGGTNSFNLGGDGSTANNLLTRGFISEVAFYTTALSGARVSAHFSAADQTSLVPTYKAGGSSGTPQPAFIPDTQLIQDVISFVSKTYQNAP